MCLASGFPVFGADYASVNESPSSVNIETTHWEVGMGGGYAFIQNSPEITQQTTNVLASFGFTDDEITVQTRGKIGNSVSLNLYTFYKASPAVWVGFEGSYDIKHKIDTTIIRQATLFPPSYVSSYQDTLELTPAIKLGAWMGETRLYLIGALGIASIHRKVNAHYVFGNDDIFFSQDSQKWYAVAKPGVGLDYAISEEGSLGVDLRYHVIFTPSKALRMFVPTAHATYHF